MLSLLAALVLVAAPAAHEDSQARPLESFEQVRELCTALRGSEGPQARLYRADVPSKAFAFGSYRARDKELELDGTRPLRAAAGSLYLDIKGIDELAFRASEAQLEEWKRDKEAGKLTLRVVFEPAAEGCRGSLFAHQARLAGKARSWQLLDEKGKVLAAADEDGQPLEHPDGPRAARVRSVALENEPPAADEGKARLDSAQRALDQCANRAQRPGSLVLSFAAKGGALRDVQIAVDGLHDDAVAGCITKALAGARMADSATGRGTATIAVE